MKRVVPAQGVGFIIQLGVNLIVHVLLPVISIDPLIILPVNRIIRALISTGGL